MKVTDEEHNIEYNLEPDRNIHRTEYTFSGNGLVQGQPWTNNGHVVILKPRPLVCQMQYVKTGEPVIELMFKGTRQTTGVVINSPEEGYICVETNTSFGLYLNNFVYTADYLKSDICIQRNKLFTIYREYVGVMPYKFEVEDGSDGFKLSMLNAERYYGLMGFHLTSYSIIRPAYEDGSPYIYFGYSQKNCGKIGKGDAVRFHMEDGTVHHIIVTGKPYAGPEIYAFQGCSMKTVRLRATRDIIHSLATTPLTDVELKQSDGARLWKGGISRKFFPGVYEKALMLWFVAFEDKVMELVEKDAFDHPSASETACQRNGDQCFVYLMVDTTNSFHKIGISNRPEYREGTLQSEKPTIELVCAKRFPTRIIAAAIESALHTAFADKRIRGEWFRLTPEDVNDLIQTLT